MESYMYKFQLTELRLNDGTVFKPGKLTILVGPNNTGKSRFLKDIVRLTGAGGASPLLVQGLIASLPDSLDDLIKAYPHVERRLVGARETQPRGAWLAPNLCSAGGHMCKHQWPEEFRRNFSKPPNP